MSERRAHIPTPEPPQPPTTPEPGNPTDPPAGPGAAAARRHPPPLGDPIRRSSIPR
jgi:hypothetical protein